MKIYWLLGITRQVWTPSLISWSEIWQIQVKFSKIQSSHNVLISYKLHGDYHHCYKTIRSKVSVIAYAYRQISAKKSNGRFSTQKSTWCTHSIFHILWWMVNSCKSYGNQADGFYAANAWTDVSTKLKIMFTLTWCRCINLLHNVFLGSKHINAWKITHADLITNLKLLCQMQHLPLNGMHLNISSTECWTPCGAASSSGTAWMGNTCARSLALWVILSISGYDDTISPHQTFQAWSFVVVFIPIYDILI